MSQTRGHGDDVAGTDDDVAGTHDDVAGTDDVTRIAGIGAKTEGSGPEDSVPEGAGEAGQAGQAPGNGQHYESFVVRVLLNTDGSIRRTTVHHIGTGTERHWPGLARQALPEFIEQAASPRLGERGPAPTPVLTLRVEAQRGQPASAAGLSLERTLLRAAEPFTTTMTIDFAGPATDADRLAYNAVIVAKPVAGGPKQTVAQAHGLFATRSPTISIDAKGLAPGAYRLDAAVSLREPGGEHALGLAAMAEGLLVHVLPG